MNLSTEESQTQRTNSVHGCEGGGGQGRDGAGVWDQQMETTIQRMDNQLGPTVQQKKSYSNIL